VIGVANIFLESLFHPVRLSYHTPIISQQGEVAGRLHVSSILIFLKPIAPINCCYQVELSRIAGSFSPEISEASTSENSNDSEEFTNPTPSVTIRVTIKQATGLPPSLSNFVFCQYTIWGHPDAVVVAPVNAQNNNNNNNNSTEGTPSVFKFDHSMDFTIPVTEEFAEHAAEGALSIEVLGHRSAGNNGNCSWPSSALISPTPKHSTVASTN
jgi:kinesin family member 13